MVFLGCTSNRTCMELDAVGPIMLVMARCTSWRATDSSSETLSVPWSTRSAISLIILSGCVLFLVTRYMAAMMVALSLVLPKLWRMSSHKVWGLASSFSCALLILA